MLGVSRPTGFLAALALFLSGPVTGATLPADFAEVSVAGGWNEAVGLQFAPDGRLFVWERGGRVWTVDNGVKSSTPFLDINDEVGGWRDYGLLGFAVHPAFQSNGLVYLMYVVDRHHLRHCQEPVSGAGAPVCDSQQYDPGTNEYFTATIGRIARYKAVLPSGDTDYSNATAIDYDSRVVLVGEDASSGFPILHQSHGTGSLAFGTDGTLLASCGDAASYSARDVGSASETYWDDALSAGIIQPKENVGAWRSQLVDSLNGKIIRIDPVTGDGLPSNPFYDNANPRSAASRTWALGLRNPFRMTLRPETGSHNPVDADPGALYIGDVGWKKWEDLHVNDAPGQNFGWPYFEGHESHTDGGPDYPDSNVANLDAPNPLFNGGSCSVEHFRFRDLIVQDICPTCSPSWPNPCDAGTQIPPGVDRFVHTRPALDWRHGQVLARSGYFDSGDNPQVLTVGEALPPGATGAAVIGSPFAGNSSTGGVWYTGTSFPAQYENTYFHGDYGGQWIRNMVFDSNNRLLETREFLTGGGGVVALTMHPTDGDLYYISWASNVRRISYVPGGNLPPVALASIETVNGQAWSDSAAYGASPLTVAFRGADSSDPESGSLTYSWNFGDGSQSTAANPTHTFDPTGAETGPVRYDVTLTVTDDNSQTDIATVIVSINNTAPAVTITSPTDGDKYPMTVDTIYDLTASYADIEHNQLELSCAWQTFLHHNEHFHEEPVDTNCATQTVVSPLGCGSETYYYRVSLTVSDTAGLSTTREIHLYPDCTGLALDADAGPDQSLFDIDGSGDEAVMLDGSGSSDPQNIIVAYRWFDDGQLVASGSMPTLVLPLGTTTLTLEVENDLGELATDTVTITINGGGNQAPTALIGAAPTSGIAPLGVSFNAGASTDPDGTVVAWDWDFGDGFSASGVTAGHTYNGGGSYIATLTVTDDDGATDTDTVVITVADAWWNTDWTRQRVLTFDNTASSTDLVDFPVLVTLDPSRIDYSAAATDGADLRFIDADGITVLDHEIESFVPGGTSRVWVRIPLIGAGSAADSITLYYGNPAAADAQNPAGVFGAGYAAVWHLADTLDSTANANHGTAFGASVSAGFIGNGHVFDGANDYIDAGADASLAVTGAITIEAWAQFDAGSVGAPRVVSKKNTWRDSQGYNLEYKPSDSKLSTLGSGTNPGAATGVSLGTAWHYLVAINDGGTARLYVDGVEVTTDSGVSSLNAGNIPLSIGRRSGGAAYLDGMIDEVRISNIARSADWIAAQHRSMTDAMVAVGDEVANDNIRPTVSIIDPTDDSVFMTPVDIILEASADDADGVVTKVDFYASGNLVGTVMQSPWSLLWAGVPEGNYVLTAMASDDSSATTLSAPISISVQAPPEPPTITSQPQAQSVNEGQTATFTVAADGSAPLAFQWRLNGADISGASGSAYTTATLTTADDGGLYSVVVSNAHGQATSTDALLTVNAIPNQPPVVNTGADWVAQTGQTIHIEATATDDGLPIPPGALSVLWSGESGPAQPQWPLGDQDQAHTHVSFPVAGTYVLRLTADDGEFNRFDEVTVVVSDAPNQSPVATALAGPLSGPAPLSVNFDGSASTDPDGTVVAWDWDFGDGFSASGVTAGHTYNGGGSYIATLTVTDDDGATDTDTVVITVADAWWNTDWTRQRVLTFDNTASSTDLVDFPVLVTLDPSRIDYSAAATDGADLRFIDADGITVLDHEIESFVPGGTSRVWVRIPLIGAGSAADSITLYYGNPAAADAQNPAGVFGAGYAAVWHLADTLDSTANANHGTAFGASVSAGFIGNGHVFDGANDYIDAGADASLAVTGAITIEAWAQFDAGSVGAPRVVSKKNTWRDSQGYNLEYKPSDSKLSTLGSGTNPGAATGVSLGTAWHYLVAINDGGTARLYVDGVEVTTDSGVSSLNAGNIPLSIGRRSGGAAYLDGMIDEVRISNIARSADWIAAQHRSMTDAMVAVGGEVVNDNFPPSVSLTSPADGSAYMPGDAIDIAASAIDGDGSVVRVDFFAGATLVGTANSEPWAVTWSSAPVGQHVLTAAATDNDNGRTVSAPVTVSVFPPPTVVIDAPQEGETVQGPDVTVLYSIEGDPTVYNHLHLMLDGPPHVTIHDLTGSYTFTNVAAGAHTVTAQLVSENHVPLTNPEAENTVNISVTAPPNVSPTAAAAADTLSGAAPLSVNFDGSASTDPDGTVVAWDWDFGDGFSASGVTAGHTYNGGGSYIATLTVTDDDGATDTDTVVITVADAWWNTDWTRQRVLTFDNTASSTDLVDFPVLVTLDPSRIDYSAAATDGADLRFIDADGITVLDHEIESFVPGGTSRVWVRIPLIGAGSAADSITLYYGNPAAADAQNPAGVFGAGYAAVWHLADTLDSTANANHGTAFGASVSAGFIGNGHVFDGANDYIDAGADASLAVTGAITIEAWAQFDAGSVGAPRVVSKKNTWRDSQGYNLEYKPSDSKLSTLGSGTNPGAATGVSLGTAWHYLVAINDGGTARLYVDGVEVTTDSGVSSLNAGNIPLSIGRRSGGAAYLDGMIDEVRISNIARSADWIAAQHRSMTDTMITFGP